MAKTITKGLAKSDGQVRVAYPAGRYSFLVKEYEKSTTKNGDPMDVFALEIGDVFPGKTNLAGKGFTVRFVIIPGHEYESFMVSKLKNFLNATGVRVAADDSYDGAKAVGKTIFGTLVQKPDNRDGTMRAEASEFFSSDPGESAGASKGKPHDEDD